MRMTPVTVSSLLLLSTFSLANTLLPTPVLAQVSPATPDAGSPAAGRVDSAAARAAFVAAHPNSPIMEKHGRVVRIYGESFSSGSSPVESALTFVRDHGAVLGVAEADLSPVGPWGGGEHVLPLVWDETRQDWKFFLVGYCQELEGVPVFGSDLRLLVRNEPGFPLVLAASALEDTEALRGEVLAGAPTLGALAPQVWESGLRRLHPNQLRIEDPRLVVWAGNAQTRAKARLAVEIRVTVGNVEASDGNFGQWIYVVDAKTGAVLHEQDLICHAAPQGVGGGDLDGTVVGMGTTGLSSEDCGAITAIPMPYAMVLHSGVRYFSDENGEFTIPNAAGGTVRGILRGRYFWVRDGAAAVSSVTATDSGAGATLTHNFANQSEFTRAQVNAYVQANAIRDFVLQVSPNYPTISTQIGFLINVNLGATCNAFYSPNAINFFVAGDGCANTAFGSVVHHEYGHHLVAAGGATGAGYGEGMGDILAMLYRESVGEPNASEIPSIFEDDCNGLIRDTDNNCQWVDDPDVCGACACGAGCGATDTYYDCGMVLAGCVWDLINHTNGGLNVARSLAINSVVLHNGVLLDNTITIDYLTLDDDDDNIINGTPHSFAIEESFGDHNLSSGLSDDDISILFQNPVAILDPAGDTITLTVFNGDSATDEATLSYRTMGESEWVDVAMVFVAGTTYTGTFPALTCDTEIEYYATVVRQSDEFVTTPVHTALVATAYVESASSTDFEADAGGWTVGATGDNATRGLWARGTPEQTAAQPNGDHTTGAGAICFCTGPAAGQLISSHDLDGGTTTLTSATFDASTEQMISFWMWYSNDQGPAANADTFLIQISNNAGTSWSTLELIPADGSTNEWVKKTYDINDYVTPTDTMRIRFRASDLGSPSIVEAAVDDFVVYSSECIEALASTGDLNGDGVIDGVDLSEWLRRWGTPEGDLNGDGSTDAADAAFVVERFSR